MIASPFELLQLHNFFLVSNHNSKFYSSLFKSDPLDFCFQEGPLQRDLQQCNSPWSYARCARDTIRSTKWACRQVRIVTLSEAGATSRTKDIGSIHDHRLAGEPCSPRPGRNSYCSYCEFSRRTRVALHVPRESSNSRSFGALCSQTSFMPRTVKPCSPFQLIRGWSGVIMGARPVLKMTSVRLSFLRCRSILDDTSWLEVSILTISSMKKSGLRLTILLTLLILYMMYMTHNARRSGSCFSFITSTSPVTWWK